MTKVFKHLKVSIVPIILVIVLLFLQAYCDLALPQYMSNIVNVGIQQGGITSVIPEKIADKDLQKLELFMDAKEISTITNSYEKDGNIYTLKSDLKKSETKTLESAFLDAELICTMIDMAQNSNVSAENSAYESSAEMKEMFAQIPDGTDLYAFFKSLPTEAKATVILSLEEAVESYKALGEDTAKQMVIGYVQTILKNAGVDTGALQMNYLYGAGALMLVYALIITICTIVTTYLGAKIGAQFARDLRSSVYRKVISFSSREINNFSNASLITRCTNDIQQIQIVIILVLRMVLYAPIMGIGALLKVLGANQNMAWIIGVAIATILALIIFLLIIAMPKFTALQKLIDRINLVSRETLTGIPVIRAFSRERYEEKRFETANRNQMKTNLFVNRVMSFMMPCMTFVMNGASVLIIWVGASHIDSGNMQVGDIMAFIQYTMQIIISFLMLSMMSIILPRAIVSAKRVSEVLNTENSINNPENAESFNHNKKGVVEFKNVSFKYPGASENVINNITFTANPGETTAIIGSTGSGKSTLINLIPRFYDVSDGEITVSGVNVKNADIKKLRDKIGYVPQKAFLFSGTIESNIAFSDENMSEEQIKKAAEIAQAKDFIEAKHNEYKSEIAQSGTNVSGGQRQRLAIARAVAKNPEIYIFDDSFSALDFKTDVSLRQALSDYTKNSTVIIVAQRISTILNAEQIIVLDDGEIVGKGTHKELLENCQVYRQIASTQLSKEELE